jgi:hypothetical protein
MAGCTAKVELSDGEVLSCVRLEHPEEPNNHCDWMADFTQVDAETWAVQRWSLEIEEVG